MEASWRREILSALRAFRTSVTLECPKYSNRQQIMKFAYENRILIAEARKLLKPTVVDVPSDNPSTSLPSRIGGKKKKDNKRSTSSSAYKPPFAEKCACYEYLKNGKSEIKTHFETAKHKNSIELKANMSKETVQMAKYGANSSKERVTVMEMTYCFLLADRNVAISFGMGIKLRLVATLRESFLKIIIDETTDVQVYSQLSVLIQYYDSETLISAVHLLDIGDGWLIGFCSDTCNVMYGRHHSLPKHSILYPGQTRWLSLEQCVLRVLEQLPALILYFKEGPIFSNMSFIV
ncbi:hypothetical protein GHT06_017144 [Daphnia sinensis]|uniref:Uncharacterized protein n=1 Tax=Daphnia sinensis TaxID=1820382 RepID=A0AAD5KPF6_9CRUS|nr:hypothetical protein GHT06_017144 [Daphnia sinensis]